MLESLDNINNASEITKAIMRYVDERLYEWAHWFMQKTPLGVGYPPQSLEYRLMTEGHITSEYLGTKPLPVNSAAEEIENLIREMVGQNHEMAEVLCCYYTTLGNLPHKAKHIGYSEEYFRKHLECARWWLASRLTLNKKLCALVRLKDK
jgi:hypothetical protein